MRRNDEKMYDENIVNDSLETCKYLVSVKNGLTTDALFDDMASLKEEKSEHSWEKVLEELDIGADSDIDDMDNISVDEFIVFDYSKQNQKPKKSLLKIARSIITTVFCLAVAFCLAVFINAFVAHQTTIEGTSMEPSLKNNDSVIIQKLSYYWRDPKRYDVIVFPIGDSDENGDDIYYIKRIIGLPGEVVQIIDGKVYINGNRLKGDKYSDEEITDPGLAELPIQLAEDEYFVLGDNRNMSTDSRYQYVGMVKRDAIEGEAWCCIWPFSHIKKL